MLEESQVELDVAVEAGDHRVDEVLMGCAELFQSSEGVWPKQDDPRQDLVLERVDVRQVEERDPVVAGVTLAEGGEKRPDLGSVVGLRSVPGDLDRVPVDAERIADGR